MDIFFKVTAGILVCLVLYHLLSKENKDISVLFIIFVCCLTASVALSALSPVLDFLCELETLGGLNSQLFKIMIKSAGIGMIAEITGLICMDAGNAVLSKLLTIFSTVIILCISLPLFQSLVSLLEDILKLI